MTEQTNADLIAELRGFAAGSESARASLMRDAADALEAAERDPNQLAAVIEQAEDYVTRHYLDTRFGDEVLPMLATAPADVLRELKAEVWDEGADAMAEHIDNGAWWEIQNPYREEQS